MEKKVIISEG